jgi:hypothetical protein
MRISKIQNSTPPAVHLHTKAKCDAGAQHAGDGKFRHPRRWIGRIRHPHRLSHSTYEDDGIF